MLVIQVSFGAVGALRVAELVRPVLVMRLPALLPAFLAGALQILVG